MNGNYMHEADDKTILFGGVGRRGWGGEARRGGAGRRVVMV